MIGCEVRNCTACGKAFADIGHDRIIRPQKDGIDLRGEVELELDPGSSKLRGHCHGDSRGGVSRAVVKATHDSTLRRPDLRGLRFDVAGKASMELWVCHAGMIAGTQTVL